MTYQVTYTHADASTLEFKCRNVTITYHFPSRYVARHPNKIGIAVDRNDGYREVTVDAVMTSTNLSTLNGMLLPAAVPTYDDTDPKIVVYRDATNSFTILCFVKSAGPFNMSSDGTTWEGKITFEERDV